ncbi:MAG: DUF2252 family protein [Planctomycetes bacterium]|nr:DUF2252 family protein [Planctomycetota bacterium]
MPFACGRVTALAPFVLAAGLVALPCPLAADPPPRAGRDAMAEIVRHDAGLPPALRRDKYKKLAASPDDLYRGAPHLFWSEFAHDPRVERFGGAAATRTWVLGDLPPGNFGAFEADRGDVVFGLGDYDCAVPADFQMDVWRMTGAVVLGLRKQTDLDDDEIREVVRSFVRSYVKEVEKIREEPERLDRSLTAGRAEEPLREFLEDAERHNSRKEMLRSWTDEKDGRRRFDVERDGLAAADARTRAAIEGAMAGYRKTLTGGREFGADYFKVKDVARRVDAGTASLGLPRYYVLIEGETDDPDDDRILDVKWQGAAPVRETLDAKARARYDATVGNGGERAARAERALTRHADDHLGWLKLPEGAFSVRERTPVKELVDLGKVKGKKELRRLAEAWGEVTAAAHVRGAGELPGGTGSANGGARFAAAVAERIGEDRDGFVELATDLGFESAKRTEADYDAIKRRLKDYEPGGAEGAEGPTDGRGAVERLEEGRGR